MTAPVGKGAMYQEAIRLTGSFHTHDEPVGRIGLVPVVGNAHLPHFTLDPFDMRLHEFAAKERLGALFRFKEFCTNEAEASRKYARFQDVANACVFLTALRKTPYDTVGIRNHARNIIRAGLRQCRWFRWLGLLSAHREYKVWCTESFFEMARTADMVVEGLHLNLPGKTGHQPLVAPVHTERLYRQGDLVLVQDWGLVEHL